LTFVLLRGVVGYASRMLRTLSDEGSSVVGQAACPHPGSAWFCEVRDVTRGVAVASGQEGVEEAAWGAARQGLIDAHKAEVERLEAAGATPDEVDAAEARMLDVEGRYFPDQPRAKARGSR